MTNLGLKNLGEAASDKRTTQMNIALSPEDKIFLKTYAAQRDTTVAAIIHEWIEHARLSQAK